ncbi:MAG: DUF378 domain-containing protein [Eubacterium ramulus]
MNTKILDNILLALVIIGAINWGPHRIFPLRSLVAFLFGTMSWFSRVIYALVGIQRYLPDQCLWPYPLHERCMKFIVISTQMKKVS